MKQNDLINEKEQYYIKIQQSRVKIADSKLEIARRKPDLWEQAGGTVDQKKDYIKSKLTEFSDAIRLEESNIEFFYNMIDVLNNRLEYCDG